MSVHDSVPDPEAPFAEPWHAQIFALTHRLAQAGHFTWSEWGERFGSRRARSAAAGKADADATYYEDWLATFEQLLLDKRLADAHGLDAIKAAWTQAYLETPHGKPVVLKG